MSGLELLGIAASIVQVADAGAHLSVRLFTMSRKFKNAKNNIQLLSKEIASTGAVLQHLGELFRGDEVKDLSSTNAMTTTNQLLADCWQIFQDIDEAVGGGSLVDASKISSDVQPVKIDLLPTFKLKHRLKFPFVEPQVELLKSKLEGLKSSLMLMLQVMSIARSIRHHSNAEVVDEQKEVIRVLIDEKSTLEQQFKQLLRTANDDKDSEPAQGSTDLATPDMVEPTVKMQSPPPVVPNLYVALPSKVESRRQEIEQHALLTSNLIQEITNPRYDLELEMRYHMQRAVLTEHADHWAPMARRYGYKRLIDVFNQHASLVRFWTARFEDERSDSSDDMSYDPLDELSSRKWPNRVTETESDHTTTVSETQGSMVSAKEIGVDAEPDQGIEVRNVVSDGFEKEVDARERIAQAQTSFADKTTQTEGENHDETAEIVNPIEKKERYYLEDLRKTLYLSWNWCRTMLTMTSAPVELLDCIGRKYKIPWSIACSWFSMRSFLVNQFMWIQELSNAVTHDRYDLRGPQGEILPHIYWEQVVKPGMAIKMEMWPLPEQAAAKPVPQPTDGYINIDDVLQPSNKKLKSFKTKKKQSRSGFSNWMIGGGRPRPQKLLPRKERSVLSGVLVSDCYINSRRSDLGSGSADSLDKVTVEKEPFVGDHDDDQEQAPNRDADKELTDLLLDWTTLQPDAINAFLHTPDMAST